MTRATVSRMVAVAWAQRMDRLLRDMGAAQERLDPDHLFQLDRQMRSAARDAVGRVDPEICNAVCARVATGLRALAEVGEASRREAAVNHEGALSYIRADTLRR